MSAQHPGSKHHAALNPRKWELTRKATFERDGYRCRQCGHPGRLECHHIIPLEAGGEPYNLSNTLTLCRTCHVNHHRRDRRKPETPEQAAWQQLVDELAG